MLEAVGRAPCSAGRLSLGELQPDTGVLLLLGEESVSKEKGENEHPYPEWATQPCPNPAKLSLLPTIPSLPARGKTPLGEVASWRCRRPRRKPTQLCLLRTLHAFSLTGPSRAQKSARYSCSNNLPHLIHPPIPSQHRACSHRLCPTGGTNNCQASETLISPLEPHSRHYMQPQAAPASLNSQALPTEAKPSPMVSGGLLFREGGALSFRVRGFLRRSRHFLGLQRTFRLGSDAVRGQGSQSQPYHG